MIENENDFYLNYSSFIKCKKGDIKDFYDIAKKVLVL